MCHRYGGTEAPLRFDVRNAFDARARACIELKCDPDDVVVEEAR